MAGDPRRTEQPIADSCGVQEWNKTKGTAGADIVCAGGGQNQRSGWRAADGNKAREGF
jgi:hypothetical protein